MFQLFCRDISCYISVVFKDLKLKLGICNLLKKCMLNIKNHWNRTILKGTFFFAPIKWATSGLVRSAQNWFQSKRYVVKIVRKNSQPKKSISTKCRGKIIGTCYSEWRELVVQLNQILINESIWEFIFDVHGFIRYLISITSVDFCEHTLVFF